MAFQDRNLRDRAARRALIVAAARALAEKEGWNAVTTRRLSTEIEYSQPVLYQHFGSKEEIVEAVSLEGFAELAEELSAARRSVEQPEESLRRVAHAFYGYSVENPALYDAMFTRNTRLRFATDDAPMPLREAFAELQQAVGPALGCQDADTLAEVLWAALHGLATLGRTGRLRPDLDHDRIEVLVGRFLPIHS